MCFRGGHLINNVETLDSPIIRDQTYPELLLLAVPPHAPGGTIDTIARDDTSQEHSPEKVQTVT